MKATHKSIAWPCACASMCVCTHIWVWYRHRIFQFSYCHPGLPLGRQSLNIVTEEYFWETETQETSAWFIWVSLIPLASTNIKSIQGCLETSHLLPNHSHIRSPDILTHSHQWSSSTRWGGFYCLVPVKGCRVPLSISDHSLISSVLRIDREAIKGHLKFGILVAVWKGGFTTNYACQRAKKHPKEGGPWEDRI